MISVSHESASNAGIGFPDMTALLDVIFILLVFLLLTANTAPAALEVALPTDESGQAESVTDDEYITITLFDDGDINDIGADSVGSDRWGIEQEEFDDWNQFTAALESKVEAAQNPEIILAGDKGVSLEKVLKLFSWLQSHNLDAAQVLMRQQQTP